MVNRTNIFLLGAGTIVIFVLALGMTFSAIDTRGQLAPDSGRKTGKYSIEFQSRDPQLGEQILGMQTGVVQLDTEYNEMSEGVYTVLANNGFTNTTASRVEEVGNKDFFIGTCKMTGWSATDNEGSFKADYKVQASGEVNGFMQCRIKRGTVKVDCRSSACREDVGSGTYSLTEFTPFDADSSYSVEFVLNPDFDGDGVDNVDDAFPRDASRVERGGGAPLPDSPERTSLFQALIDWLLSLFP